MTSEAWRALRRFAGWAVGGGLLSGGLSWWARVSPAIGGAAQLAFTVAGVLFGLQLMRDTRRMERERLEIEKLRAAAEVEQLETVRGVAAHARAVADELRMQAKETALIREQTLGVLTSIDRKDWLQ